MAKISELPYALLHYIMLLLVQSPGGAADFARIVSVCKNFILFAQDKSILELVNFDMRIELENFKRYQHINSLLVRCSEAGNVAAQFSLGKVILVSFSQILLAEWQKVERDFHPWDCTTLNELSCILATNVPTRNHNAGSFMAYFLPKQESTSEFSQTRLVHYQLVKLFLLHGSPNDLAEMSVFLKSYVMFFTTVTEEDSPLLRSIKDLVSHAGVFIYLEKQLMDVKCCIADSEGFEVIWDAISMTTDFMERTFAESRAQTLRFFELNLG